MVFAFGRHLGYRMIMDSENRAGRPPKLPKAPVDDHVLELVSKDISEEFAAEGKDSKDVVFSPTLQKKLLAYYVDDELDLVSVSRNVRRSLAKVKRYIRHYEKRGLVKPKTVESSQLVEADAKVLEATANAQRLVSLADRMKRDERIAEKIEDKVNLILDATGKVDWDSASLRDKAQSVATLIDKMRLLREQSTTNVMQRQHSLVEHIGKVNSMTFVEMENRIKKVENKSG